MQSSGRFVDDDAISIPGGDGLIGTRNEVVADDGEKPLRRTKVRSFVIGATTVTNAQFRKFVEETGYTTEAERLGWSFVFWSQLDQSAEPTQGVQGVEWWRRVDGANWKDIVGPGSKSDTLHDDHPVVHVSWNDAQSYANWVGGRLPSEVEWEHAARGGLGDVPYPWGEAEPDDTTHLPCNIWQGAFPRTNTLADGFANTAPARSFKPNGYGLFNVVGNVWEWTADVYKVDSLKKQVRERMKAMRGFKLLKGGSFLCHKSYCHRYRIAARTGSSADSSTSHQGFRVVWDVEA
ncbi:MAG: formylglycine-generating enzyme family protein [Pseudomonadota bacterium]